MRHVKSIRDPNVEPESKTLPEIQGPPELQAGLKKLLQQYIGLLQAEVPKKPAEVPLMMLNVEASGASASIIGF